MHLFHCHLAQQTAAALAALGEYLQAHCSKLYLNQPHKINPDKSDPLGLRLRQAGGT